MRLLKLILSLIVIFTVMHYQALAQTNKYQELKAGDYLPKLSLNQANNSGVLKLDPQNSKTRLLILDFWNANCASSVEDFEKLGRLQSMYPDQVKIIRVTRNSPTDLTKLAAKNGIASRSKLPVVYADSLIAQLFPITIPHQAWIDQDGKVIAVTSSRNASSKNIDIYLKGENPDLPPFANLENFNPKRGLNDQTGSVVDNTWRTYSLLTGYINGIQYPAGTSVDPDSKKIIRRAFYNISIKNLVQQVYGNFGQSLFGGPADNRQIIVESARRDQIIPPEDVSLQVPWTWDYSYCYEIQVTPDKADSLVNYIKDDIQKYFNIKVSVEKKKMPGMALVLLDQKLIPRGEKGHSLSSFNTQTEQYLVKNQPMSEVSRLLMQVFGDQIVSNETGLEGRVNLVFQKTTDKRELRSQLNKYGLDLIEKEIEAEFLVIRDM